MSNKSFKPIIDIPSTKQLKEVIRPYSDEEISNPVLEDKLQKLIDFFDQYGIDYSKFKPEHLSFITGKVAYPNYDQYIFIPGQHDTKKWLLALKDINYKQKAGLSYKDAIKISTQGWKKMEIYDFLNWFKFYDEGTQMKYKFAQVWYENGQPGYFLHIKPDAPKEEAPVIDSNALQEAREDTKRQDVERQEEKRNIIEKQRSKIIGRLDSAEKLLRSPEGQQFAGAELEQLMEAIYALKKKVQLVNKLSISTRLYEDMIVRESNMLKRQGFNKAAAMLYSIAQSPAQSGESATGQQQGGKVPMDGQPPADPSGAGQSGTMSGLPATVPGTPSAQTSVDGDQNKDQPPANAIMNGGNVPTGIAESTPAIIPQEPPQPNGIKYFIENMNDGMHDKEFNNVEDDLKIEDDTLEVSDRENEELMVTEAQAVLPPGVPPAVLEDVPITNTPPPERGSPVNVTAPIEKPEKNEEPLEVTEDDIPATGDMAGTDASNFDTQVDNAFKNVTIADVVEKLESISKYYKTREHPRQLSVVDMMLDSLGLASLFPSLSEALNKSLEANNYISTRVDDILAKLRGAMASAERPTAAAAERPEVADIKGKLQSDQDKEIKRKQMRKEQEVAELEGGAKKETPNIEMGELAPPVTPSVPPITPPLPVPPKKSLV